MVSHYYRNVSGVALVYDASRRDSFESLKHWLTECKANGLLDNSVSNHSNSKPECQAVPMLIIGNKCEDGICLEVGTNEAQM